MSRENHDTIIVLDFGAQYSQLIARRVRECGVYSQIYPFTVSADEVRRINPKGIIFSGGPASVKTPGSPRPDSAIFSLGIPILGICYGLQVMSEVLGGNVICPEKKEYGLQNIDIVDSTTELLKDVSDKSQVWMSHGDSVEKIPAGFRVTAKTPTCPYTVIEWRMYPDLKLFHRYSSVIPAYLETIYPRSQSRIGNGIVHHRIPF